MKPSHLGLFDMHSRDRTVPASDMVAGLCAEGMYLNLCSRRILDWKARNWLKYSQVVPHDSDFQVFALGDG